MIHLPFDWLRVNGTGIEFVVLYPFVVSLSNHSNDFFNTLLRQGLRRGWVCMNGMSMFWPQRSAKLHDVMRARSLDARFSYYLRQLNNKGYIFYPYVNNSLSNLLFKSPDKYIYIHKNGILKFDDKKVDLKIANKNGGILLGNLFGLSFRLGDFLSPFSKNDPYEFIVSESNLSFLRTFSAKIIFKAYYDTDIIYHILNALSDGRSLNQAEKRQD